MLKILVTGAAGLIGGDVCARLAKAGHAVHALVHRNPEVRGNDGTPVPVAGTHHGDVRKPHCGLDAGALGQTDCVIHCAASLRFDLDDADYARVNVDGTAHALALAEALDADFLYVSTAYVCGQRGGVIPEGPVADGTDWANGYEASKAAAEAVVRASGRRFAIARPSIVLGEADSGRIRGFDTIYGAFKLMAEGHISRLPASIDATLDFVALDHVTAAIAAIAGSMERAAGGTFHLVSGGALPVADFVRGIGAWPQFRAPELVDPDDFDPATLPPLERRLYKRVAAVYASYFQRSPRFDNSSLRALTGLDAPPADADYFRRQIAYCIDQGFLSGQAEAAPALQRTSG